jgi:hypothetical protein
MNPSLEWRPPRGPQVDVIYPGPDALNEQQLYVCESKRIPNQARKVAPWR